MSHSWLVQGDRASRAQGGSVTVVLQLPDQNLAVDIEFKIVLSKMLPNILPKHLLNSWPKGTFPQFIKAPFPNIILLGIWVGFSVEYFVN